MWRSTVKHSKSDHHYEHVNTDSEVHMDYKTKCPLHEEVLQTQVLGKQNNKEFYPPCGMDPSSAQMLLNMYDQHLCVTQDIHSLHMQRHHRWMLSGDDRLLFHKCLH